jgi:transposase-like protein
MNKRREHPMKNKITNEVLDQLLEDYESPEDLIGSGGLLSELKKRLITRVMDAELTTHLGYDKNEKRPAGCTNARNGHSSKRLRCDDGELDVNIPRDREGDFNPTLVPKHQRHFDGFDDVILSLYSRGLTTRDIQGHLEQMV